VALLGIIRRLHLTCAQKSPNPPMRSANPLAPSIHTPSSFQAGSRPRRPNPVSRDAASSSSTRFINLGFSGLTTGLRRSPAVKRGSDGVAQFSGKTSKLGFEGSYDRGAAFARVWREGQIERVNPSSKRPLWYR
jgi:hypothetical protein